MMELLLNPKSEDVIEVLLNKKAEDMTVAADTCEHFAYRKSLLFYTTECKNGQGQGQQRARLRLHLRGTDAAGLRGLSPDACHAAIPDWTDRSRRVFLRLFLCPARPAQQNRAEHTIPKRYRRSSTVCPSASGSFSSPFHSRMRCTGTRNRLPMENSVSPASAQ